MFIIDQSWNTLQLKCSAELPSSFWTNQRPFTITGPCYYLLEHYCRAKKKRTKSCLVKAEPLPICKMENDCMNNLARWWIFLDRRNYLFKEGKLHWYFAKILLLVLKLRIAEIQLQHQIHKTSQERLKNKNWILNKPSLTLLWSKSQRWNALIFGWKSVFKKINLFLFVIWQVKFLKYIVFVYLVLNLMLYVLTYIILSCKLIKPAKLFSFFILKSGILISRYILGNFLYYVYLCISIILLRIWRPCRKHFKWKQQLSSTII